MALMMKSLRLLAIAKKTVLFEQSSNRFFTINEIYGEIKILQSELHKLIKLNKINCQGEVLGNCNTIVLNMIHFILI